MRTLLILSVIALSGCSNALKCNDSGAKSQVLEVIDSHLEDARWYQDMKSDLGKRSIFGINTTRENKDLGRYACSATYTFEYKGKVKEAEFSYELKYLEDEDETQILVDVNTVKALYMTASMGF